MNGVWETLGITPTSDRAAIRRAYGAKLRQIDQDRDPGGFIALRHALALALQSAPLDLAVALAPTAGPEAALMGQERQEEKARIEGLFEAFATAEQAKQTEAAVQAYQALMAAGGINMTGIVPSEALQLGLLAAGDKTLDLARVNTILHGLGLDAVTLDRLKRQNEAAQIIALTDIRSGAEHWFQTVARRARERIFSRKGWRNRRKIILARYLLGSWPTRFLVPRAGLGNDLKAYDPFKDWLEGRLAKPWRLAPERRRRELAAVKAIEIVTGLIQSILVVAIFLLILAFLIPSFVIFCVFIGVLAVRRIARWFRRRQPAKGSAP